MKQIVSILSLCLAISMTTGCGRKDSNFAVSPAESPKSVLITCFTAMYETDKATFLTCFDATAEEREALSNIAESDQATEDFKKKFIKVYGVDKWKDFQDPEKAPEGCDATLNSITKDDLAEIDTIVIDIKGDKATFPFPGEAYEVTVIRRQNGWLIDATSFFPPGVEPKAFGEGMLRAGNVTRKYMKAIGHKGITPEDIDAELGRAFFKEIFGMSITTKQRFNIDEL